MEKNSGSEPSRKRSAARYWVEVKGKLYARLQYKADDGRYKVKYRPISDKRTAKRVVDDMRRELETHGQEALTSDKLIFRDFAERFQKTRLVSATYSNGVKISGRRSLASPKADLRVLLEFFGRMRLRSIKPTDLEQYKTHRLNGFTKRGTQRKLATVNRELALLRTMLNFAVQNDWLIQNPFNKVKGIISLSAKMERNRVLSFDEERRLLAVCVGRRSHLRPLIICASDK